MEKRKIKLPDQIDWRLVKACRKKGETWKEISARTGIRHQSLRDWAAKLKKTELLGGRRGSRITADWNLIADMYRNRQPLSEIAEKAGLSSGHSLSTMIANRRRDGRWSLPKMRPDRPVFSPQVLAFLYPAPPSQAADNGPPLPALPRETSKIES
jgi:transposase-like protein